MKSFLNEAEATKQSNKAQSTRTSREQMMPKNGENTKPDAPKETPKMPSSAPSGGAEVSAAADRLAKMTVDDSSTGTDTSNARPKDGDPELFKPCSPMEDCPVCLVPLPIKAEDTTYFSCCGKSICNACVEENHRALRVTNMKRKKKEQPQLGPTCPFCRTPESKNDKDLIKRYKERISNDDYWAIYQLGHMYKDGVNGLPKDESKALELYHRAAEMGSIAAISELGYCYTFGRLGCRDEKKGREFLEIAAKKGRAIAHLNLGCLAEREGNIHLAIRHWHIAAAAGHKNAMKSLWTLFSKGKLSKVDLEKTLRAHKDALDEMNSEDRERLAASEEALAGDDEMLKGLYGSYYLGKLNAKELQKALECNRGGNWNHAEIQKIFRAARARLRASGCM